MRSDASKLSLSDYNYIMQYVNEKSKPLNMLSRKFRISNRRLYQIWRGEEIYKGTFDNVNNRNETLTNSVNNSIIETNNYSVKSVIDGKEKKKKSRSKPLREQSSPVCDSESAELGKSPNVQCDISRRDTLQSSNQVPVNKNISFESKLKKLQKGVEQIKRTS